jgi:hypothetical protein
MADETVKNPLIFTPYLPCQFYASPNNGSVL